MPRTMRASFQLIRNMKNIEVMMFTAPQAESKIPQVISSDTRSVSEVTRAIIQPTGVLEKYAKESF